MNIQSSTDEKPSQMNKNRMCFSNGSIIEAIQNNIDNVIRGRGVKLFPKYYNYDTTYSDDCTEITESVLKELEKESK